MNKTSKTNMLNTFENVSILQGGGSLSAFGYGVFNALAKGNVRFDISQALQLTD
jgi:predicted acylesterase/phospholipase RssA